MFYKKIRQTIRRKLGIRACKSQRGGGCYSKPQGTTCKCSKATSGKGTCNTVQQCIGYDSLRGTFLICQNNSHQ